jgi:uncharacterized membrane protein YfcA
MLFLAGILCSAGGIGGGGVYVTLLMVVGKLAPRDAVPLSKAIVFLGSLSSLVLNLRRMATASPSAGSAKSLIDYSICRVVVPASLLGTLLGVLFNRMAADWVVVSALCGVLSGITIMVTRTAIRQRIEENLEDAAHAAPEDSVHLPASVGTPGYGAVEAIQAPAKKRALGNVSPQDAFLALGTLLVVILCGVLRAHATACAGEIHGPDHRMPRRACHHPINAHFYRNRLEGWMLNGFVADAIQHTFLVVPIFTCLAVIMHSSHLCIKEGWTLREVGLYVGMGVTTGILAGLVGIGGGLIFSPFFLVLGVDPHVAVATSSTCVIFTSSSTTLQYFLTDRIISSLAVIYGIANLVASWAGTSFVHFLQDNFQTRKSYITMIVAVGVFLSTVLSVVKLATTHSQSHTPVLPPILAGHVIFAGL